MPDIKARTAEAARIIESNPGRDAAVRQFRLRWGMPEAEAQQLYLAAVNRKKSGGRVIGGLRSTGNGIIWHFTGQIAAAVFLVIFGVVFALLFPRISDKGALIATGLAMVFFFVAVLLWASISARRKDPAAARKSLMRPVVMALPLLLVMLVPAIWSVVSDTPGRSDLDWRADVPERVNQTNWIVSGELENKTAGWRAVNFEIDMVFYDGDRNRIGSKKVELTGVTVGPGETQQYIRRVETPQGAERYSWRRDWDWEKVE